MSRDVKHFAEMTAYMDKMVGRLIAKLDQLGLRDNTLILLLGDNGTGVGVTNVGVGSNRYRVTFKGPGGHSFGAFGMANPIQAMGRAIAKIDAFEVHGNAAQVRLVFHPPFAGPAFLDSYCTGPSDLDISHAHALPDLTVPVRALARKTLLLHASSTHAFHAGPFQGTLAFSVDIRLRRSVQLLQFFRLIPIGQPTIPGDRIA